MAWRAFSLDRSLGYKALASGRPALRHFQRIADANDFALLDALEAMTDELAREEIGLLEITPARERARLGGAEPALAAFTRFDRAGSLFSDGSFGVHYLRMNPEHAVHAATQDLTAFLTACAAPPHALAFTLYRTLLQGDVADLRELGAIAWTAPDAKDGAGARELGRQLRSQGAAGALYADASLDGADSLALFNTFAIRASAPQARLEMRWDGNALRKA